MTTIDNTNGITELEYLQVRHGGEATLLFDAPVAYSPTLAAALDLYAAGLNVIPIRRERRDDGRKRGFQGWKRFRTTRANLDGDNAERLFGGPVNLAILTGHTSGNLVALDCENETALLRYLRACTSAKLPHWAWKSGGTKGGGCILLRCADGAVADLPAATVHEVMPNAGAVEVWGSGTHYVVCPPSAHPTTGELYQWLEGHTPLNGPLTPVGLGQLQALIPAATLSSRTTRHRDRVSTYLSQRTTDFLRSGAPVGERNERLFMAACDLYGCELYDDPLDFDHLWDALERAAQLSDTALDHFGTAEIRTTIRSARSEPRQPARFFHTSPQHNDNWQRAAAFAEVHTWTGRTGTTDRAAFLALCERARIAGRNGLFRASMREIAEIAGMHVETVMKAVRRLLADELVEHVGQDHGSGANLYRFTRTVLKDTRLSSSPVRATLRVNRTLSPLEDSVRFLRSPETAERGALGKTADLVWHRLLALPHDQFLTAREVADLCNITIHQARRALHKLVNTRAKRADGEPYGMGLVYRTAGNRYQAWPVDDDWLRENVTDPKHVTGRQDRRRARFAAERADRATRAYIRAIERDQADDDLPTQHSVAPAIEAQADQLQQVVQLEPTQQSVLQQPAVEVADSQHQSSTEPAPAYGELSPAMPDSDPLVALLKDLGGEVVAEALTVFFCALCGQQHVDWGGPLPDQCDHCGDFTTWLAQPPRKQGGAITTRKRPDKTPVPSPARPAPLPVNERTWAATVSTLDRYLPGWNGTGD